MALVLVVEDEVDLGQLMRERLVADGHEVVVAQSGEAAMAAVSKRMPDVVLLDWMLPDMDGLAVCRRLRQQHVMPIIMVTARGDEIDRVLGLEVGADDYLVKPFSLRELESTTSGPTWRRSPPPAGDWRLPSRSTLRSIARTRARSSRRLKGLTR